MMVAVIVRFNDWVMTRWKELMVNTHKADDYTNDQASHGWGGKSLFITGRREGLNTFER